MAINQPNCDWVIAPWLPGFIASTVNSSETEAEDLILEHLGNCQDAVFSYLSDTYVYTLIALYCIILPIGFFGNLTVMWLILSTAKLRKSMNFLLLSLAVSDWIAATCMPWTLHHNISYDYVLGKMPCRALPPIQGTAVMSSIYVLVLMSIERHQAIVFPTLDRFLSSNFRVAVCIAVMWILSFCFQIPQLIVLEDVVIANGTFPWLAEQDSGGYQSDNGTLSLIQPGIAVSTVVRGCVETWSDDQAFSYSIAILIVLYVIPLVVLVLMYARIGYMLSIRRPVGNFLPARAAARSRRKRRLMLLFVLLVVSFAVFWGPFFILQCLKACREGLCNPEVISYLQWLGHANVALNPLLYAALHERIRETFLLKTRAVRLLFAKLYCAKCRPTSSSVTPRSPRRSGGEEMATISNPTVIQRSAPSSFNQNAANAMPLRPRSATTKNGTAADETLNGLQLPGITLSEVSA